MISLPNTMMIYSVLYILNEKPLKNIKSQNKNCPLKMTACSTMISMLDILEWHDEYKFLAIVLF